MTQKKNKQNWNWLILLLLLFGALAWIILSYGGQKTTNIQYNYYYTYPNGTTIPTNVPNAPPNPNIPPPQPIPGQQEPPLVPGIDLGGFKFPEIPNPFAGFKMPCIFNCQPSGEAPSGETPPSGGIPDFGGLSFPSLPDFSGMFKGFGDWFSGFKMPCFWNCAPPEQPQPQEPQCTESYMTCSDGTHVKSVECINGKPQLTGNSCPVVQPQEAQQQPLDMCVSYQSNHPTEYNFMSHLCTLGGGVVWCDTNHAACSHGYPTGHCSDSEMISFRTICTTTYKSTFECDDLVPSFGCSK